MKRQVPVIMENGEIVKIDLLRVPLRLSRGEFIRQAINKFIEEKAYAKGKLNQATNA